MQIDRGRIINRNPIPAMPMSTTFEIVLEARGRDWLHIKVFGMSSTAIDHFSHFEAVLWALLESSNAGQAYVAITKHSVDWLYWFINCLKLKPFAVFFSYDIIFSEKKSKQKPFYWYNDTLRKKKMTNNSSRVFK